jgi:hypothetical protein
MHRLFALIYPSWIQALESEDDMITVKELAELVDRGPLLVPDALANRLVIPDWNGFVETVKR